MWSALHVLGYCVAGLAILTSGGNWACQTLLTLTGMKDAIAATVVHDLRVGRVIGGLERLVIAIAVLAHSWELIAGVVALKTVARFKELDEKTHAEYFLVGSLFSLLWAIVVTSGWTVYDRDLGSNLQSKLVAASSTNATPINATPTKADAK